RQPSCVPIPTTHRETLRRAIAGSRHVRHRASRARRSHVVEDRGVCLGTYWRATAAAPFLKMYFWIFPVAVLGSFATKVTPCGALKCARRSRVNAISSASLAFAAGFSTTYAKGASPHFS